MTGDGDQEELELGLPAGAVSDLAGSGPRDGLAWSWELDVEALLAAVSGQVPWSRDSAGPGPARPTAASAPTDGRDDADHPAPPVGPSDSTPNSVPPATPAAAAGGGPVPPVADADAEPGPMRPDVGFESADELVPPAAAGCTDAYLALDQADAELAEYLDAVEAGRSQTIPLPVVAGRIAETVPTGPGLAGWLGIGETAALEDGALAGMAASCGGSPPGPRPQS